MYGGLTTEADSQKHLALQKILPLVSHVPRNDDGLRPQSCTLQVCAKSNWAS